MATRTVVCPECEAPLAPGRFSCASCGALVASVASTTRPLLPTAFTAAPQLEGMAPDDDLPADVAPSTNGFSGPDDEPAVLASAPAETAPADPATPLDRPSPRRRSRRAAAEPLWGPAAEVAPSATRDAVSAEQVAPAPTSAVPAPPPVRATTARPAEPAWPSARPEPQWPSQPMWPPPAEPAWPTEGPRSSAPFAPVPAGPSEPSWPSAPTAAPAPPSFATSATAFAAAPLVPATNGGQAATVRNPAGAYLPPSAVLPPAEALPLPSARAGSRSGADGEAAAAGGLAAIQLAISPRAPSLMIAGGAGVAILGFLLPWADYVLGASGMSTYFDRWGLAGPGHPIVLALVVVLAVLALIEERLPSWARPRTVAVAIACLLIGLAWPYLLGPYDPSLGLFFVTAGAVLVFVGGLVGSTMPRHADSSANV